MLEVSHILRTLSEEVNNYKFTIIQVRIYYRWLIFLYEYMKYVNVWQASHWAVILDTAASHTAAAKQQSWVLPQLIDNNEDDDQVD